MLFSPHTVCLLVIFISLFVNNNASSSSKIEPAFKLLTHHTKMQHDLSDYLVQVDLGTWVSWSALGLEKQFILPDF